jgi:uncharacterized protein (DUF433 family)
MKETLSVRIESSLLERLKERARSATGGHHTTLAHRYIEEGLRMDEHPRIYFRSTESGRRPALRSTRLDVTTVVDTILGHDGSMPDAAEYLGVPIADIEACAAYYVDYRDELDQLREELHAEAERAVEAWRRQQAVFAS